ncbi:hypothetical protein [Candidatus Tisiphia endosymbiont of Ditula angustiorana]|uniref:hypothetical protein n=1 Tax=Candidatus Tisiphia endosymbiont of Ditula angustiorana TaxID=3066272 RepID=UPI00312C7B3F
MLILIFVYQLFIYEQYRKSISLFRYGLDYLQRIFLNIAEMMEKWMEVITKFIKPIIPSLLRLSPC